MNGNELNLHYIGQNLLKQWNLWDAGWRMAWNNKKQAHGSCAFGRKKIYLSRFSVRFNTHQENVDTLLHELAHALAFTHDGHKLHGPPWKRWAMIVGATPEACAETSVPIPKNEYNYHLIDTRNGKILKSYFRRPRKKAERLYLTNDPLSIGKLAYVRVTK